MIILTVIEPDRVYVNGKEIARWLLMRYPDLIGFITYTYGQALKAEGFTVGLNYQKGGEW
jgi:hypothetical protein